MRSLIPPRRDLLLAVGVAALAALEVRFNGGVHPKWAGLATELPFSLALAWRRRAPILVVLVLSIGYGFEASLGVPVDQPVVPVLALVIALYSVALHEALVRALLGYAVIVPGFAVSAWHIHGNARVRLGNIAFGLIIAGAAWTAGRVVRARTESAAWHARRAERLDKERLLAVAEERTRIAREMHDVIAHSLSVMVVQAGAASQVLRGQPDQAAEALETVQETGRQALVEMSRLLGLLRDERNELGLAPQPGLRDLNELLDQVREAGLPVELALEGTPRPLPFGVDLAAYRLVQEALTNSLKHAGPAQARVLIRYRNDEVELEIVDTGSGAGNGHTGGHGLLGMRERVAVFGGEFEAAPRAEGGYAVHARLPFGASAS